MVQGENTDNLLIVEGRDDKHVVEHIWRRHQPNPSDPLPFEIIDKEGLPNLLPAIGIEIRVDGRENLGILVDADDCVISRWKEVMEKIVNELGDLNGQLPEKPDESGTIINTKPRIGIWVMPNNLIPGELEDFIGELIPDKDSIWPRANCYIDSIPRDERKFKPQKELKAKIHAWLATCEKPRLMGRAIRTRDLDAKAPLAQTFYDWLCRLFD
ncbi:MAG: hypothetical protein OXI05_07885 [Bacteroidota bacterium]|nr:hypothetical protein [Bacteroidota bacterium]MXW15680.1 hypothetical protein [Rhodothermaceae bacterium]MXW33980.1 hypothetical protein [Rhodothermaceae bacterium]MYC04910.1 hypothetical protein [Rhodothermaceae bacterium]MYE63705.1 hypothetical protein [Rhodothermaceae bacterium]